MRCAISWDLLTSGHVIEFYIHSLYELLSSSCISVVVTRANKYFSVLHARLRLKTCALNDCLFQINCSPSPKCRCGMENESVMHFFFACPLYAAQRHSQSSSASSSAALTCGSLWLNVSSKKQKLNWFLYGYEDLDLKEN